MEAFWFLSCSLSSVNQSHLSRLKMPASKQHGEEKREGICLNPSSESSACELFISVLKFIYDWEVWLRYQLLAI